MSSIVLFCLNVQIFCHVVDCSAATKSLQSSENAHKHTTAELQRTRTTLHALRTTHNTEIKKLEKERNGRFFQVAQRTIVGLGAFLSICTTGQDPTTSAYPVMSSIVEITKTVMA